MSQCLHSQKDVELGSDACHSSPWLHEDESLSHLASCSSAPLPCACGHVDLALPRLHPGDPCRPAAGWEEVVTLAEVASQHQPQW